MRIVIMGNAGSGKTTLAQRLAAEHHATTLSQDAIAFQEHTANRRPLDDSIRLQDQFIAAHARWIIEGCYGDLIQAALPHATHLIFLNPGVAACIANCKRRAWEPEKFSDKAAQDVMLNDLINWVREYDAREDEFGLKRHRAIFDAFTGDKRELTLGQTE